MGSNGGILLAIALTLWLIFLIPAMRRRLNVAAVERNTVELRQELQMIAENSEVPRFAKAEAEARRAVAQERKARREQRELLRARTNPSVPKIRNSVRRVSPRTLRHRKLAALMISVLSLALVVTATTQLIGIFTASATTAASAFALFVLGVLGIAWSVRVLQLCNRISLPSRVEAAITEPIVVHDVPDFRPDPIAVPLQISTVPVADRGGMLAEIEHIAESESLSNKQVLQSAISGPDADATHSIPDDRKLFAVTTGMLPILRGSTTPLMDVSDIPEDGSRDIDKRIARWVNARGLETLTVESEGMIQQRRQA